MLVNSMLKGEGRMNGAKLWLVACLGGRLQLLLLCVCDKTLYYDAGILPARAKRTSHQTNVRCKCSLDQTADCSHKHHLQ